MLANAERFARIAKERRLELDLNQMEVWQAGGPSNTTLTEIENGRLGTLTRTTARKLDVGLRWEPGSARRTWEGGDPTPLPPATSDPVADAIMADDHLGAAHKQALVDALRRLRAAEPEQSPADTA